MALLEVQDVRLVLGKTVALAGVNATVSGGEIVALTGPSGSGKSSLLYCMSGIVQPTSGTVIFNGTSLTRASESDLSRLRREQFGFVFQFGELVPELTLGENVSLPLEINGVSKRQRAERVAEILARLDIDGQADRRPAQVSGGQAQRAAVARALVHQPSVVFADEPTGSLDSKNSDIVLQAMLDVAREQSSAVIIATHDPAVASSAGRTITLADGHVVSVPSPAPA